MGTLRSKKIIVTVTLQVGESRVIKVSKKIPNNPVLIGEHTVTIKSCCDLTPKVLSYKIIS